MSEIPDPSIQHNMELKISEAIKNDQVQESVRLIEDLKFFLATAPANWQENQVIRRYYLNPDEGFVSCIFWNNLYFITGTDIVRCIVYKFQQFGRKIIDRKKFEEGIFSDLRNLKCGTDAVLESPKSSFLDFLYKNNCLRTQKKQKVFFWFNVPHDKLMADALERDLKKEKMGQKPTTIADREPALSFQYEDEKLLYNQLLEYKNRNKKDGDLSLEEDTTVSSSNSENVENEVVPPSEPVEPPETQEKEKKTEVEAKEDTDDEDDDFPLDYFQENNDNIVIDRSSNFVNFPDYDFSQHQSVPPSQVVLNDEYLIEQTHTIKTPIPVPRSGRDDFYPYMPLSAKFQQTFALPAVGEFPPHYGPMYPPYYQQDPYYHDEHYPDAYGQYSGGPYPGPYPGPYAGSPGYMVVPEGENYPPQGHMMYPPNPQIINPTVPPTSASLSSPAYGHFAQHTFPPPQHFTPSPYAVHFPNPSSRQQSISANMMTKKRQMMKKTGFLNKVSKPLPKKFGKRVNFETNEEKRGG